ncbi:MAG: hypothetical protein IMF16_04230 [Proteobacteria bacterium]|nr:hypothetical protein [Pseudomonadota bacterium]
MNRRNTPFGLPLALALVLIALGAAAADTTPARTFPNTTDGIFVFNDQITPGRLSEAQVRFAATHYVGSQKMTRPEARQLRRHNPNFLVLHYRLAQALGHSSADENCRPTSDFITIVRGDEWVREWPGDEVVVEEWFYHWHGSRVYGCDWGHYLMDLDNPAWREWWSARVIEELIANENDGVFADSFHVPSYGFTWTPPLPVVDPAFEAEWARREHDFTDYMRQRFAGRWLWIPNIGGLVTTRDPSDYSNIDGAMIEGFAAPGHGRWFPLVDWELEMNRLLPLLRADKIILAQSYPELADMPTRLFLLSCYLLIKGEYTYLNLELSAAPEWLPEYDIDLGPPIDPLPASISEMLHPQWQVYARRYAKGLVLVNPTEITREVDLGATYHAACPQGGGPVPTDGSKPGSLTYRALQSLTLAPHQGAVLLTECPAP